MPPARYYGVALFSSSTAYGEPFFIHITNIGVLNIVFFKEEL